LSSETSDDFFKLTGSKEQYSPLLQLLLFNTLSSSVLETELEETEERKAIEPRKYEKNLRTELSGEDKE